jgi:RNA polymerase sigma factor (sigma-70 family)
VRDLRPWLFRAAFRIARGLLKGRPTVVAPVAASHFDEGMEELMELCTSLSDAQRRAFVLRDVLGFSTKETADLVGSSEVSVRVHLHAARRRLRTMLEEVES